ncbi:WW domain binding protein 11 [Ophiocordyceps camponoti-floridani]|uniref:WW domain binding protein 11 n=1 Tax=Ophiocordyceps camponoti-floridani TaxID=2030778 RepID=A0A8H4Q2W4_9HYPO|nr:WW domain binding protein 11 [Ophiocordyceps camponoti-floridani]
MPKERNYNPVQAQRKAEKARAIKKGKAEVQERRNEKLARKNPDRIQRQIDDLKAGGEKLSRHQEQVLQGLEREFKAVTRAREALGERAPTLNRGREVVGKRRRDSNSSDSGPEVTAEVSSIPMPRDTPPPIPREALDRWHAKRRARRARETEQRGEIAEKKETEARWEAKAEVAVEHKTVYESKPVMRDLYKEAVAAFVPQAVQIKMAKRRGLMEPEEADRLEEAGYLQKRATVEDGKSDDDSR